MRQDAWLFAAVAAFSQWLQDRSQAAALERAMTYLERALDAGPVHRVRIDVYCGMALHAGRHDMARRLIDHHLRRAPNSPSLRYTMAEVALAGGEYLEALRIADSLLEEDPEHQQAGKIRQAAMEKLAETLPELAGGNGAGSEAKAASHGDAKSPATPPGP